MNDETRTLLLNDRQVEQKINRLAYQLYEDNAAEKEIIIAGIMKSGYRVAEKIAAAIRKISPLEVIIAGIHIDKHSQVEKEITVTIPETAWNGKVIVIVDDVLNSGKTMMYAMKPFLVADIKKLRTVVLVDRNHKRYPVSADFVGVSLATNLKEHVAVEFRGEGAEAWLS
jgi:pyrimidine operon attenuation protein / uracil phosphoribosyltransferase